MFEKLKLLYPSVPDDLLKLLLDEAESFVCQFCNVDSAEGNLEPAVLKIVQEDLSKIDSQGIAGESAGGVNVSYTTDYSPAVYKILNKNKRVKLPGRSRLEA